jgi:hypothetical protein
MLIKSCLDKFGNSLYVGDLVSIDLSIDKETYEILEIRGTEEKAELLIRICIGLTPFNIAANKVFWVKTPRRLADEE